jgi:hypothetical protein
LQRFKLLRKKMMSVGIREPLQNKILKILKKINNLKIKLRFKPFHITIKIKLEREEQPVIL